MHALTCSTDAIDAPTIWIPRLNGTLDESTVNLKLAGAREPGIAPAREPHVVMPAAPMRFAMDVNREFAPNSIAVKTSMSRSHEIESRLARSSKPQG
jgi:hypothetical protein